MAAPKHQRPRDRSDRPVCLHLDRVAVSPDLAASSGGLAAGSGRHPSGEQLCAGSDSQGLWNRSGDMGLSSVRDDIRRYGARSAETEVNLLTTILGSGVSRAKIQALLGRFGGAVPLSAVDVDELTEILGSATDAAKLKSILQIAAEFAKPVQIDHPVIGNCVDLIRHLQATIGACRVETFRVLFLDAHNRIILDEVLWSGTVSEVQVYPREVIRRALELDSCAFIAAHNHPSNVVIPSPADIAITRKLLSAAGTLGIAFHDHFIVSTNSYHSMRFHRSIDPWE
jgi:DNA repair protein RadC